MDFINECFYVCPDDRTPLKTRGAALRCTACGRAYGLTENVLDLDIVKSGEREMFDAHFRNQKTMSAQEIAASAGLAERFLFHVGPIEGKKILDMACGNGALTHGLLACRDVVDCDLFCFDHSFESLRVLLNTAAQLRTSNRIHPSVQDVHRSAYPDNFFDVIFGNAILHHFLRYEEVLAQVYRSLKKDGFAVFAEPFVYGYLWAAYFMRMASQKAPADVAGKGLLDFMIKNTFFRVNSAAEKDELAPLTDKHFFFDDEMTNLCADLGFRIRFAPLEPKEYYAGFMDDMLRTYGITNPQIASAARALYADMQNELPRALHRIVPHFKFIVLSK